MNAQERIARIRERLLKTLHAVHPTALKTPVLRDGVVADGIQCTDEEILSQLDSLAESSLVIKQRDELNAAIVRWKLTEKGRVVLADLSLI